MIDDGLLIVWGMLVEAMHGKASHGGEAEVYAYLLQPVSPSLLWCNETSSIYRGAIADRDGTAKRRLVEIFKAFERIHQLVLIVDGLSVDEWQEVAVFDHRVKIGVGPTA